MHNLRTVINFEFLRTIKKKSFWISSLAIPVMITVVFAIVFFSNKSAAETEKRITTEKFSVAVLDESGILKQSVLDSVGAVLAVDKEEGKQTVKEGKIDSFIYLPPDVSSQAVEVFGQDVGLVKNGKYAKLAVHLIKTSIISKLDSPTEASILQKDPTTKLVTYTKGEQAQGIEQIFVPGAFVVLFYLVIVLLGNHMLTSTTEEKENRVIEIILTSVDASSLIIGKIISIVLAGVLQLIVISLPAIVGLLFFRDSLSFPQVDLSQLAIDPARLAVGAILFIFSFLLFTGLLVTIGAVVPTAKEAGNFFGIAMFFMFVPLYAVMAIVTDPAQMIVKVFSFFPLTAPITLLLRNAVGNLTTMEIIVGILILAISSISSLFIATRAFRYGTLEYERKLSLKRIFKG